MPRRFHKKLTGPDKEIFESRCLDCEWTRTGYGRNAGTAAQAANGHASSTGHSIAWSKSSKGVVRMEPNRYAK